MWRNKFYLGKDLRFQICLRLTMSFAQIMNEFGLKYFSAFSASFLRGDYQERDVSSLRLIGLFDL